MKHSKNLHDAVIPAVVAASAGHDMEPRTSLLLRPAKLIADGVEILCILREVSGDVLKVDLFQPLGNPAKLDFELPDGARLSAELREADATRAILAVDPAFSPAMLRRDWSGHPQRKIRLKVRIDAILRVRETTAPLTICDISQQGARVECNVWLCIDEPIRIEVKDLPPFWALVRWRTFPEYGIVFDQAFQLEELAHLCASQQPHSAQ